MEKSKKMIIFIVYFCFVMTVVLLAILYMNILKMI